MTTTAVPVRSPALRDALIHASLDPRVRSIDDIASAWVAALAVTFDAVVIKYEDGRYVLDVVPMRCIRDLDEQSFVPIAFEELNLEPQTLTEKKIGHKSRRTNANLVWAYNGLTGLIGMRLRFLQVLLDEGPMPLGRLLKSVVGQGDAAAAVMALACANLVRLDCIKQPLSPTTRGRLRVQAGHA